MAVPYTGSYKMFNTGSTENPVNTSIRGAQKHDANDAVDSSVRFTTNISNAQVPLFDERYAGNVFSLDDVTKSSQWRGYPVGEVSCYTCSFEEITNPAIKNITYSCSALDPGVEFKVIIASVTQSLTNGSVTVTANVGDTLSLGVLNVAPLEEEFIGLSYTPDGSTGYISETYYYNYTVPEDDVTIYALVGLTDSKSLEFCYHSAATGQNTVCSDCSTTRRVFFDRSEYTGSALEDLIWYDDASLTTKAPEGQYRQLSYITSSGWFGTKTRTVIDSTIYYVSGSGATTPGAANIYKTCTDGFIYCS